MSAGEFWMGFATIVAVITGPVIAVFLVRGHDKRREENRRKYDIFRTLMRTRKLPIHYDHVGALNLVEVEFTKHSNVIQAWNNYLKQLGEKLPPSGDAEGHIAVRKKRDALLAKLISEIAKALKIKKIEQLDILEGNYLPQGWDDVEEEQRAVRHGLIKVLEGTAPIVIQAQHPPQTPSPYPPPPTPDQIAEK